MPMDPMKALASLELVTARGLDSGELGPRILADSVSIFINFVKYTQNIVKISTFNKSTFLVSGFP